jgi:hypothetical protein
MFVPHASQAKGITSRPKRFLPHPSGFMPGHLDLCMFCLARTVSELIEAVVFSSIYKEGP